MKNIKQLTSKDIMNGCGTLLVEESSGEQYYRQRHEPTHIELQKQSTNELLALLKGNRRVH